MKIKKFLMVMSIVTLVGATGMTTFAATTNSETVVTTERLQKHQRGPREDLTDEQKAEMEQRRAEIEAKKEAMNEKWASLTDAQKEEIYALKERSNQIDEQMIDRYLELGLIDEETANQMKECIQEDNANMRTDNKVPMLRGKGGRGFGTGKFKQAPSTESNN